MEWWVVEVLNRLGSGFLSCGCWFAGCLLLFLLRVVGALVVEYPG